MDHGTTQMYRKELRDRAKGWGDGPCLRCREAQARYIAEYRRSKPPRDRAPETRATTIRRRALNRLALEYPERLAELVDQEAQRGGA